MIVFTFSLHFLEFFFKHSNKSPPVFVFRMKKNMAWKAVLRARLLLQTWRDRGRHRVRAPPPPSDSPQRIGSSLRRILQPEERSPLSQRGFRFSPGLRNIWSFGSGLIPVPPCSTAELSAPAPLFIYLPPSPPALQTTLVHLVGFFISVKWFLCGGARSRHALIKVDI